MLTDQRKDQFCIVFLWVSLCVYIGLFFTSAVLRYYAFDYYDFDLAVYSQVLWNITQGQTYNSILGVDFLGHHAHFFAFLLAPFYKIIPHPLTALFLQTLALGSSAFFVFLIAKQFFNTRFSVLFGILYLLYPPVGYVNAFEFHFPAFAVPTTLLLIYFFLRNHYKWFLVFCLLNLSIQENMTLVIMTFGLVALIQKRSVRWWLVPMGLSLGYMFFCIKFLFPSRNPDIISFISVYSYWGASYGEIIKNIITHPVETFLYVFQSQKLLWLSHIFLPFVFLSLFSPLSWLPSVPLFLQHLLSNRAMETIIHYHYTAEIIPWMILGLILAIHKIKTYQNKLHWLYQGVIGVVFLNLLIMYLFNPPDYILFQKDRITQNLSAQTQKIWVQEVPPQAPVIATFEFLSHLTNRQDLYSFHHIYTGQYTLSSKLYHFPKHLNYEVLLDIDSPMLATTFYHPKYYLHFQEFLEEYRLVPVKVQDNMILFRSSQDSSIQPRSLYQVKPVEEDLDFQNPYVFSNPYVVLKDVIFEKKDNLLWGQFQWQPLQPIPYDFIIVFSFRDEQGNIRYHFQSPSGYRIYPSQAWKVKEEVIEYKYITIPEDLRDEPFDIDIAVFDLPTLEQIFQKQKVFSYHP